MPLMFSLGVSLLRVQGGAVEAAVAALQPRGLHDEIISITDVMSAPAHSSVLSFASISTQPNAEALLMMDAPGFPTSCNLIPVECDPGQSVKWSVQNGVLDSRTEPPPHIPPAAR